MSPPKPSPESERRIKRSQFAKVSLHAWLVAVARRTHMEGFVVADAEGLLIGGGIEGSAAEELAVVAASRSLRIGELGVDELNGQPFTVRRIQWEGEPLFIAALGDLEHARAGLAEAVTGVERILSESSGQG